MGQQQESLSLVSLLSDSDRGILIPVDFRLVILFGFLSFPQFLYNKIDTLEGHVHAGQTLATHRSQFRSHHPSDSLSPA